MRLSLIEDEEKVSRFVVKGLTAERFPSTLRPKAIEVWSWPKPIAMT
jgi:hypothetical protein